MIFLLLDLLPNKKRIGWTLNWALTSRSSWEWYPREISGDENEIKNLRSLSTAEILNWLRGLEFDSPFLRVLIFFIPHFWGTFWTPVKDSSVLGKTINRQKYFLDLLFLLLSIFLGYAIRLIGTSKKKLFSLQKRRLSWINLAINNIRRTR